jgi:RNA polymerase sigma-70 factor (ECF subfamily)
MLNSDLSTLNDDALVQLCRARGPKDDRPFAELFRRHQRYVWNLCYRFTGNTQDAEDLVQEIFFRAYRGLAQFEGRASFKTWLHRIALNVCRNELRRLQRRQLEAITPIEDLSVEVYLKVDVESIWSDQMHQAMVLLRNGDRRAIRLRDLEGRSYNEIARELGVGLSAAKMRVARARIALQKVLHKIDLEGKTT